MGRENEIASLSRSKTFRGANSPTIALGGFGTNTSTAPAFGSAPSPAPAFGSTGATGGGGLFGNTANTQPASTGFSFGGGESDRLD